MEKSKFKEPSIKERLEDFRKLDDIKREFDDHADKLKVAYRLSSKTIQLAKVKVNDATAIIQGKEKDPKNLKPDELKRILQIVSNMSRDGKVMFTLIRKEDGSGLYEPNTGQTFDYE